MVNPIRLVSGAATLPAHAAAAVLGTSVGIATTGARTTARVLGRVIEQLSGSAPEPATPWQPAPPASDVPAPVTAPVTAAAAPTARATKTAAAKAPAKKTAARKAPAKKAPARKAPARKAPSKQAAVLAPALGLSEAEVEAELDGGIADDITTPSGIPAAGEGYNPDTTETDLHQPGTEPLMDPATVKAVASESEVLRRAADTDKG